MKTPAHFLRGSFFCVFSTLILSAFSGCVTLATSFNPQIAADQTAVTAHFVKQTIPTSVFKLVTYSRLESPGQPLTVYIEGDGRVWLSKNRLADDPTPFHPMTLQLATLDSSPNIVYLGRPCQYDSHAIEKPCEPTYWSNKRFSEEVIVSMNEAIDVLVKKINASGVHLVGYSGGGAVAVLLAARRQDIASIRTIAGNLDPAALNVHHGVSLLKGSLDPMEAAQKISDIPQRHFIGSRDTVVLPFVSQNFLRASGNSRCVKITEVRGATHHTGWIEEWKKLVTLSVACGDPG